MKTASLIARLLLGLIFLVFGLNGFLHFIPMPPPTGVAGQYFGAIFASHYWVVIFGVQVIGGLLLLINRGRKVKGKSKRMGNQKTKQKEKVK